MNVLSLCNAAAAAAGGSRQLGECCSLTGAPGGGKVCFEAGTLCDCCTSAIAGSSCIFKVTTGLG